MFKQRKRKKGSRRTPSVRDNDVAEDKNGDRADDSNNGESHDDVKERLEIMRALQKSRSKRPGLFLKAQLEEEDDAGKAQRESEVAEQSSMKRLKKLGAAFQQKATENFEDEYLWVKTRSLFAVWVMAMGSWTSLYFQLNLMLICFIENVMLRRR